MVAHRLKEGLSSVSSEPLVMIIAFGNGVKFGAGITNALLFEKVCKYELGYPVHVCDNLTEYEDQNYSVQEMVNSFSLYNALLANLLSAFASFFIGAFADKYGWKSCINMAFVGNLLEEALNFLNYAFLEELPLEVLYLGAPIATMKVGFFMAVYGIISRFSPPEKLSSRMALTDGLTTLANIAGTIPSAAIFRAIGYNGVFGIMTATVVLALAYNLLFVKNFPQGYVLKTSKESRSASTVVGLLRSGLVQPLVDLYEMLRKPRRYRMRPLVMISILAMILYYSTYDDLAFFYPYMLLRFDITPEDFSMFNFVTRTANLVMMFSLVPLLNRVLGWHESEMMVLFSAVGAASLIASAFAASLWQFILASAPGETRFLCYPTGRSLLTNMVEPEEVPKVYGFLNVLVALVGLGSTFLYRFLYDSTLRTYPSAFLLLSASIMILSGVAYFMLMVHKKLILKFTNGIHKSLKEVK